MFSKATWILTLSLIASAAVAQSDMGQRLLDQMATKVPGNKFELVATSKPAPDGSVRVYYRFVNADTLNVTVCYPITQGGWFCEDGAKLGRLSGVVK